MKITSTRRLFLQGTAITGVAAAVAGCSQKSAEEQKEANKKKNDAAAKEAEKLPRPRGIDSIMSRLPTVERS